MRVVAILSGLLFVVGCGKSKEPVDLSIDNPKAAETTADAAVPDVETPENARKLLIQAAKLAKQGMVGKSIELLSHAISMNSEDPELYIARAEVYGIMREDANALADYSTAIRVRPDEASIHNRRGFFLLSRSEHTRALKDFSAAIRLNPKSAQAYNNRGLVYLSIKQSDKAIADFSSALQLDPEYADAWNNRGYAQYSRQKYPEALKDLSEAVNRKPGYVNALNNRALTYMAMQKFEAAVSDFSAAIESSPNEIKLIQGRRSALLKLERYADARSDKSRIEWLYGLAAMTKKIDRDPFVYGNYIERARYLAEGNEHAAALRDYSRAAQVNNQLPEPFILRAESLIALGELDKAIRDCDTAIELGNQIQQRVERTGKSLEDPNGTVVDSASVTLESQGTLAYSVRGDIWMAKKQYSKAIADFETAGRFDPTVAEAYVMRAKQFEAAGQPAKARADRQRAAAIDPSRVRRR